MQGFIFWIVLCILVAIYANNKGKSPVLYFIISVFLSPLIGLLIVLITGNSSEKDDKSVSIPVGKNIVKEDNDRFSISFRPKDDNSWSHIKSELFEFYKKYKITKHETKDDGRELILGVENNNTRGYVTAKLYNDTITVETYKVPKPDKIIFKKETLSTTTNKETRDTTDKLIELGKLLEKNLITKEEFDKEKQKILGV